MKENARRFHRLQTHSALSKALRHQTFTTISFKNPSCENSCYANEVVTGCLVTRRSWNCCVRSLRTFRAWIRVRSLRLKWVFFYVWRSLKKSLCCDVSSLCISVAVVIGVYWCSTIYLNMIKEKRYIHLPHVCSLCIYIQWLPFAKKSAYHLSQCYIRIMNLFVPPAGSYNRSGTWLLYVMICLTEQCNRRTVHYSLVGKRSMLCAPGLWGTLADIMVLSVFPTLLFL